MRYAPAGVVLRVGLPQLVTMGTFTSPPEVRVEPRMPRVRAEQAKRLRDRLVLLLPRRIDLECFQLSVRCRRDLQLPHPEEPQDAGPGYSSSNSFGSIRRTRPDRT